MKTQLYAIWDAKAQAALKHFEADNDRCALRLFITAANDPNSDFSRWAADYTLFHIGSYDPQTMLLEKCTPENLGCAITFQNVDTPPQDLSQHMAATLNHLPEDTNK